MQLSSSHEIKQINVPELVVSESLEKIIFSFSFIPAKDTDMISGVAAATLQSGGKVIPEIT